MAVKHFKEKNIPSVYFGGITVDEVKRRGLPVNEENERKVREEIRAKEGKVAYAERIIKQIGELFKEGNEKVVVDGLYSWTEYKAFRDHFSDDVTFIAVTAPRKLRHERLAMRAERPLTEAEADSRDYAEIENLEKGGPIANADYTLVNDGSKDQLVAKLREISV